jgi:mRNA-degrading endonuclease HigB of HigAB toxin-antitoxin module
MSKYTKKWNKEFLKRYSLAIKELRSLEEEFKEMEETNPDELITSYADDSIIDFGKLDGFYVFHVKGDENTSEYIDITLSSRLGGFCFHLDDFKESVRFRNDFIEALDKFNRPQAESKELINDDCENEEGWEDNEEEEYTIQCSRTCVETWTHTVMARSVCEAYEKAKEGEGHDENNDYNDYSDTDYESI